MKNKELDDRFGDLYPGDMAGDNRQEIEDIRKVYQLLMDDDDPELPESLDSRFYELLKEEMQKAGSGGFGTTISKAISSHIFMHSIRIATGIALFLLGWFGASWLGNSTGSNRKLAELTSEVGNLRESLILTMIRQNSPVERIQAVNMVCEMTSVDERITSGLLNILSNDPNDNVRMVALETLLDYADIPSVREGLIRSITRQKSPLLQLRLAEVMVALEEKRSVEEFQKILTDITLDYNVRDKLNQTVEVLL